MHCIVLAAGTSKRLRPHTDTIPKCLLTVGSQTILERAIREVFHAGIMTFTIVTGFAEWKVRTLVMRTFPSISVDFVNNKEFDTTENAVSLLLARDHAGDEGLLLLDSDIMFDEEIVRRLIDAPEENCAAVRLTKEVADEEIKVAFGPSRNITKIGKQVSISEAKGESIGMEKFSPAGAVELFRTLERRIGREGGKQEYYEASFQDMIDRSIAIHAVDTGSLRCIEIDTPQDLELAESMFASKR